MLTDKIEKKGGHGDHHTFSKVYYVYTLDLKTANQFLLLSLIPPHHLIHETTHPKTQVSTAPLVLLVRDQTILSFMADTPYWLAD